MTVGMGKQRPSRMQRLERVNQILVQPRTWMGRLRSSSAILVLKLVVMLRKPLEDGIVVVRRSVPVLLGLRRPLQFGCWVICRRAAVVLRRVGALALF